MLYFFNNLRFLFSLSLGASLRAYIPHPMDQDIKLRGVPFTIR